MKWATVKEAHYDSRSHIPASLSANDLSAKDETPPLYSFCLFCQLQHKLFGKLHTKYTPIKYEPRLTYMAPMYYSMLSILHYNIRDE